MLRYKNFKIRTKLLAVILIFFVLNIAIAVFFSLSLKNMKRENLNKNLITEITKFASDLPYIEKEYLSCLNKQDLSDFVLCKYTTNVNNLIASFSELKEVYPHIEDIDFILQLLDAHIKDFFTIADSVKDNIENNSDEAALLKIIMDAKTNITERDKDFYISLTKFNKKIYANIDSFMEKTERKIKLLFLLLYIFICLITFFILNIVNKSIISPLHKLSSAMKRFGEGQKNVHVEIKSKDEIGIVASEFTAMSAALADKEEKLLKYSEQLEETVQKRTEQLRDTNKQIMDSINYAKTIQLSILPSEEKMQNMFKNYFVLWKERDLVGGDFFWFDVLGNNFLLALVDCTGHGVPGAFMTMTVNSILNRIIGDICYDNPARILKALNSLVRNTLNQQNDDTLSDDGLDIAICYGLPKERKLIYAGAKIPLYVCKNNKVVIFPADKQSIGYKRSKDDFLYTNHEIKLEADEIFYLTTDGYIDQNGGMKGYPFGKRQFKDIILKNYTQPFEIQKNILETTIRDYRGENFPQMDDITVMGFQVKE